MSSAENKNEPSSAGKVDCAACRWEFDRKIPSEPDNCAKIIALVLEQLERFEWSNRDVFAIHMAMEESILNAIRHGNQCLPDKLVHIQIEINHDKFYSRITDQGQGFDLDKVPDPTLEENLDKTSGRGVMLIRTFMDQVIYNEVCNSLELTKTKT